MQVLRRMAACFGAKTWRRGDGERAYDTHPLPPQCSAVGARLKAASPCRLSPQLRWGLVSARRVRQVYEDRALWTQILPHSSRHGAGSVTAAWGLSTTLAILDPINSRSLQGAAADEPSSQTGQSKSAARTGIGNTCRSRSRVRHTSRWGARHALSLSLSACLVGRRGVLSLAQRRSSWGCGCDAAPARSAQQNACPSTDVGNCQPFFPSLSCVPQHAAPVLAQAGHSRFDAELCPPRSSPPSA